MMTVQTSFTAGILKPLKFLCYLIIANLSILHGETSRALFAALGAEHLQ